MHAKKKNFTWLICLLCIIVQVIAAKTVTIGQYEDGSCTKPLQNSFLASNPLVLEIGKCEDHLFAPDVHKTEGVLIHSCDGKSLKETVYPYGCENTTGAQSATIGEIGICYGNDHNYFLTTCN